ncbi:hypothetical protein M9H77_25167 [Catharanthus roseus]|uniref:Uncharacterized protein n=1 Tax=Catharanthus roseus TaxID=4058 RepID=A0ACC0A6Z1_CATRO|nr:hypothetical protein M9H77_25167 [Catharanthus roseus]
MKSNPILRIVSNKISHLVLKKIWLEISRAPEIIDDPKNKYNIDIPTRGSSYERVEEDELNEKKQVLFEHVSIAHQKIQKSSGSGSGTMSRSGSGSSSCGRRRPPRVLGEGVEGVAMNGFNMIGDGNCGYRVVADFVFGDEHQWSENNNTLFNYKCMTDARYPLYTCNGFITSDRVSSWADVYYDRIADWNARVARNRNYI